MATFFMSIRGDQLGTFTSVNGTGNGSERVVTLSNVEAVGDASEIFTIQIDQANTNETEFRNGQFITITDSSGNIVVPRTSVQPDDQQGLGAGDQHLILFQERFFIQLAGVPVGPESIALTNADESAVDTLGDNDGNLDFTDVGTTFPCFAKGTQISTPAGLRACETLDAGDMIMTSTGPQRLIWVGQRQLNFPYGEHPERPISISAGAFGDGIPKREVNISPQHKVLVEGAAVRKLFHCESVLAPAKGLLGLRGVRWMQGKKSVTYVSLLLDTHQVICVEGAGMESLYPGPVALRALGRNKRAEIANVLPGLVTADETAFGPHAFRPLTVRETEMLVEEIKANEVSDIQIHRADLFEHS